VASSPWTGLTSKPEEVPHVTYQTRRSHDPDPVLAPLAAHAAVYTERPRRRGAFQKPGYFRQIRSLSAGVLADLRNLLDETSR
jgi:hypothetical protein